MLSMFDGCWKLTSLDLSTWDTSNVQNMGSAFTNCESLTSLDLSSWNISKDTMIVGMFSNLASLNYLKLGPDFSFTYDGNNTNLQDPTKPSNQYSWFNITNPQVTGLTGWKSDKLWQTYKGNDAGTYYWGTIVWVHYQDEQGHPIQPDIVLKGHKSGDYTVDYPDVGNYIFDHIKGGVSDHGKFGLTSQEVTCVYKPKIGQSQPADPVPAPPKQPQPVIPPAPVNPSPISPTRPQLITPAAPVDPNPTIPTRPNGSNGKTSTANSNTHEGEPMTKSQHRTVSVQTSHKARTVNTAAIPSTQSSNRQKQTKSLPQTGQNKQANAALMALGGLMLVGAIASTLFGDRKKD